MNFIENILHRLGQSPDRTLLQEIGDEKITGVTGGELASMVKKARSFLRKSGAGKGDRCGLLANNSTGWTALDLALMAEGIIVVPLYARQAPRELVGMMRDAGVALICCGDESLRDGILENWTDGPQIALFDEIFATESSQDEIEDAPVSLADSELVTIIYTSGTSGEPKGVMSSVGNVTYMLGQTNSRLDLLMGERSEPDRIFHYLPFCFAGSWILMLTALSRSSVLAISTDLNRLADEMKQAAPNYFLNVPALLERVKSGIEDQIKKRGGVAERVFQKGRDAWFRRQNNEASGLDGLWLALANRLVFSKIKEKVGPNLKALICGSAPLAKDTQLFFFMLGIPVLQVYGLTETTAICTMDDPRKVAAGRVGPAIEGIEMKLGEGDEIVVRGPNIFPGYWNRVEATEKAFIDGWFRTGDQGEVDGDGNWSIIGRIKNLIILSSGHNIAPEPIEEKILQHAPGAQQVVVMGNGRSFLSALVTGDIDYNGVEAALEIVNPQLPHYKRIHAFHIKKEALTIESGLLTANGKLKREVIAAHFSEQMERLYAAKKA